jgi:DNA-binding MurR/RpiR family transcriptional regulator
MDAVERYLGEMERTLRTVSRDEVRRVVGALVDAWRWSKTVWIVADGGVLASYLVDELHNAVRLPGQPPLRVRRFADQHDAILAGDVVIALAGTSDRDYAIRTIARAKEVGALTVALLGSPSATQGNSVDFSVTIPTERSSQLEDASSVVMHAIALALRERIELHAVSNANKAIAG